MPLIANQPPKALRRVVEQIFSPRKSLAFPNGEASHESDDRVFGVEQLAHRPQRNQRLGHSHVQGLEVFQLALPAVEQRMAIGTGDSLRLIGSMQRERPATFRAVDLQGGRVWSRRQR